MARYAYAPLSVDEGGVSTRSHNNNNRKDDEKVSERMFTFIGLCILIAITFVLSRSNGAGGVGSVNGAVGVNGGANANVKQLPLDTAASAATQSSTSGYVVPVGGSPVNTNDNYSTAAVTGSADEAAGPVIQIAPSQK
eukprot:scaffold80547_cov38-Cyclotella_meneghiniana.AAC.1